MSCHSVALPRIVAGPSFTQLNDDYQPWRDIAEWCATTDRLLIRLNGARAPISYDDFDDERLDTPDDDPDGIHPDVDGHLAVAEAITPFVAAALTDTCRR